MHFDWDQSRQAFHDAAGWYLAVTGRVGDRWDEPGLGEWTVRDLVGHTSRSFVTVETYLAQPADTVTLETAGDYIRAASVVARGPEVAQRGRDAAAALGPDPVAAVSGIGARVRHLVDDCTGQELMTTIVGGMRLGDYLPTRTFELAVHTADLAVALGEPLDVPASAARQALAVVADIAVSEGKAGPLLLQATGRTGLPEGFSVF
ncbi:maleylpyruvate isomerase family mycothiol-dependent enzyme [Nocardioides agariphilus]|jgi:uncharacterized protein (TIGR03083 family)|uniref:Maleylpyruvate isomerase family mycothiol-dependent enzyme n=1 Tax=Nocardioides agariphilus TaxID=433664 RepID=A0A930YLU3_9ACTN|nr:maleylpyruvate isomerase family mycothiol-dependent enzyme [Nocardioides agariphilus]MBF4767429.1 maleylpyruvate isomerase family mycothiol-dependent enzyme [Nocardioides agariphilus]